ncbi:NFX1-type zinc finger-containing protein 1-like [Dendronephthya gigantea]|uniref:NFX1-type zinc finger-containing protein 1-like n=1 Tax=Dendronephthya gigantea TaxID=151771 RepID=UPI001068DD88|nr:NFX1-type zinc finger-containing protein 1-like [Dendronephthya gigantea]
MKPQKKKRKTVGLKQKENTQWHKGTLCPIRNEKSIFIKPRNVLPEEYNQNKDVFMHPDNVSKYVLPLKGGDSVEFVLGERDKERPMARKVKLQQYSKRSCQELLDYIAKYTQDLQSPDCKKVLMETLSNTIMWNFLASPAFAEDRDDPEAVHYVEELLRLLKLILRVGKGSKNLVEEAIKTVVQGTLFKASNDKSLPKMVKSSRYIPERDVFYLRDEQILLSAELIRGFCHEVIRQVPTVSRCLLPVVSAINERIPNPSSFLFEFLSLALSGESSMIADEGVWQELPFIPTDHELAGNLVEADKHLSPVKNSYLDPESYMDTYFRLLRAETFSAIQHGIKELKDCELDERDMNVYHNIHLAGFEIQHGRFSLAVHFSPARDVKKWEASPQLMFGNLVCISLNRKFDDVIWAVVSNRDTDILNKHKIIMLELIDENTKKMSQIISSLQAHAGSGVMVESPTYYHSLSPILRSLKEFDMESFPLQAEVVYADKTSQQPNYLRHANTVDTSPIYKESPSKRGFFASWMSPNDISNGTMDFARFLEVFNAHSSTSLEASQTEALKQALTNRLAIIQGPPGCGKTFIGVKIVQLLLSLSPKLGKPILLLTYKNHALDEFLKHMLQFCSIDDLVRIGSRSKEPELEPCNLQEIMRSLMRDKSYSKAMFAEIQDTRNEIDEVQQRIKELSSQVDASSHLTKKSFIDDLSEEQLRSLLVEAAWGRSGRLKYRVNSNTFVDRAWANKLVDEIGLCFGSIKNLFQMGGAVKDETTTHCFKMFEIAFEAWLPNRQDLRRMKEFHAQFVLQVRSERREEDDASNVTDDGDDQDSGDEEHVKELLETRMIAGFKQGERSKDGVVLFKSVKNNDKKGVLIEISDYPNDMQVNPQIRLVKNLWNLNEIEKLQFLHCILNEKTSGASEEFDELIEKLELLKKRKEEMEMNKKVEMLLQKKIIGVTITGASINHDLLHQIGPSVVIVEEAAEILEPSLLAALTSSLEHLILIGDHKQLKPQVDTYELRRDFQFNKSMMERLIDSGFPFKSLTKQNRMRPEFSALLHDIYPNLEDNLEMVSLNQPLKCIKKSMYFWSHESPEKHERTYTNVEEADRIIALVLYLLWNGCRPSEITVLSAYLGQTKLLRNQLKKAKAKHQELFQETAADDNVADDEDGGLKDGFVQVQTIDMYQGDENKYILVSLVRSNKNNKIGFLKEWNRRCVAQSRAKCGMYFVGNLNVLRDARNSPWYRMINSMIGQECAGYTIPLRCSKHATSIYEAIDADGVKEVMTNPKSLCKERCGVVYPCGIHCCKRSCLPSHSHASCVEIVDDWFPGCGHPVKRKCVQPLSQMLCRTEVKVCLPCGHEAKKECHQRTCDILCHEPVVDTFPKCGHKTERKCYVKIEFLSCEHPCTKMNSCGVHRCVDKCGKAHRHDSCQKMIDYTFPVCKHPSPKRKKCSEDIAWNCTKTVYFTGICQHPIAKQCYQQDGEVKCPVKPCGKKRKCGHPCTNTCGDDCEKGDCRNCHDIHKEKMRKFHEDAKKRVKDLEDKITRKTVSTFSIDEVHSRGSSAAEYQMVNDLVVKFTQKMHNWFPKITKIEKVTNLVLEKKFEEAKSKAFGDYIAQKFHGTDDNGVRGITQNGFRMPDPNPPANKRGMYGQGIYFATDSSKSAQNIYTKGSQKLLLCLVILGKSKTVQQSDYNLNKQKLRSHGYDSVFAPRGTAVKNDEFVIFDPDQALPQYIIHFSDLNTVLPPSPSNLAAPQQPLTIRNMLPTRTVNFQDPFEMYYSFAESHFRRMAAKGNPPLTAQQAKISSIDIVINNVLETKFQATKRKFQAQGIPDREILAYHGTAPNNIQSILQNNLQLSFARRQAYGRGNYFSEFPGISLGYGHGLLLCRILPGKEFVNTSSSNIPVGYNSKKVLLTGQPAGAAANANGEMIIIDNSDQILPFYVIHR